MSIFRTLVFISLFLAAIIATLAFNKNKMASNISTYKEEKIPVTVITVSKMQLTNSLSLVGTISANKDVLIIPETQGKIIEVLGDVGDYKAKGEKIYKVDSQVANAQFIAAEANYVKTKKDYERFTSLAKENSASEMQLDNSRLAYKMAESQYIMAKKQLENTTISAPISGIITMRNQDLGNVIDNKSFVGNMVDMSVLKVKLNLAEKDVFKLKRGDLVEITTDVYPNVIFNGKINFVSLKGDDAHTYPTEISLKNDQKNPLKIGMFCRVNFKIKQDTPTLMIPREALVGSIRDAHVYVVENNLALLKSIVVGQEFAKSLEVISGLKENDLVIKSGQNNLINEAKIEIVKE